MNHFKLVSDIIKPPRVTLFEQILAALDGAMTQPTLYGWFHLLCLGIVIALCILLCRTAKGMSDKKFNLIIGITSSVLLLLEIYKQFNFSYDPSGDAWDYQWYAFPFQFCSTPMYVMFVAAFLKNGKVKSSLCSFLATYGFFAGSAVMFYPGDVFIRTIGINIQTMVHHGMMVVIGIFMYASGRVELSRKTILRAMPVFAVLLTMALMMNILYVQLDISPDETFNMFYISPYFVCTLPILDIVYSITPYIVFLLCYVVGFTAAGAIMPLIVFAAIKLAKRIKMRSTAARVVYADGKIGQANTKNTFSKEDSGSVFEVNAYMPTSNISDPNEKQGKRIAIVTGASSGIGKEFFLSLNMRKAELDEIWVVARSEGKLEELHSLTDLPLRVFPLDLSEKSSTAVIETALKAETPSIRYLICASGFGRFNALVDDNAEILQNMVDLNCRSIVGITRVAFPYMAKGGAMLLIASVAAFQPIPYIATYGATKAFVLSYGRALDKELRTARGARCMCVCPFWTKTAFFDRACAEKTIVKKYSVMYQPEQIVKKAWKDLKHKKRDVSIYGAKAKGQVLLVKLLPHRLVMWVWKKQQKLK